MATLRDTLRLARVPLSLDVAVGDEETRLLDLLPDEHQEPPDAGVTKEGLKATVAAALDILTERERMVLSRCYGLHTGYTVTLKDIGEDFGISRERVRQIKERALGKLRSHPAARRLIAYVEDT